MITLKQKISEVKEEIEKLKNKEYNKNNKNHFAEKDLRVRLHKIEKLQTTLLALQEAQDIFIEMIDDVDIELMFTDIKDKEGNKDELSDDVMEIIRLWWEKKSEELKEGVK